MKVRNMTEGRPIRLIFGIALPLMLGNVFQQLYTVVDASVVGKGLGVAALAALGASDWLGWLFLGAIQGMAQGFSIPMAQAFGAGDYDRLRKNVGGAVVAALLGAAAIALAAQLAVQPMLTLLGIPGEIRPMAVAYLRVFFAGLPVAMDYNVMAGLLRALGDGRSPLYAMVVASLVNIGLDLLFVLVFCWGVEGAAWATVIAQVCSCLFCLHRLRQLDFLRMKRSDLRPELKRLAMLMKMGLPVALQNITIAVGGLIVQRVINGMGVTFIAGYTAAGKFYGVMEIAAISYGYAMTTYVGQNLGAGKFGRIRRGMRAGVLTGVATASAITATMFAIGQMLLVAFIDMEAPDAAEALRIGGEYLWVMSAGMPLLYVLDIYRAALQGLGGTVAAMSSGIVDFAARVCAVMVLPVWFGYRGIYFAGPFAWLCASLLLVPAYYIAYRKQERAAEG